MRSSLIAFGVIFLIFGGVLFYMPTPTAGATTTTVGEEGVDTKTTYASVNTPWQLVIALLLIGVILFVLGLTLPETYRGIKETNTATEDNEGYVVETKKHIETEKGRGRSIVHEEHERRVKKAV